MQTDIAVEKRKYTEIKLETKRNFKKRRKSIFRPKSSKKTEIGTANKVKKHPFAIFICFCLSSTQS
jgi:hypothetical protein